MSYRNKAALVGKGNDSQGYYEVYSYRGNEYFIYPNNEVPEDMQHYFEQSSIDFIVESEYEAEIQDYLEEKYEEDFC